MKLNLKEVKAVMCDEDLKVIKALEAELLEMLNDKTYANYHLPWFSVVREILG